MAKKYKDVDSLVMDLVLSDDTAVKLGCLAQVWKMAKKQGVFPASIHTLYKARGTGLCSGFTVPAINLRSLTYDLARAIFRVAKKQNAGAFIFEIAKSEMGYTDQRPAEYAGVCLAAAVKEGYKGPVFIQGDHFQVNQKKYAQDAAKELQGLKDLIRDAISCGFFNIDIDSSTVVDLGKESKYEQQRNNYTICAELTKFIRSIEPPGVIVSIGGEIGEVGGHNSDPEELNAFMKGYKENLSGKMRGISKISVQTGTSHGGVVLPNGAIAEVKLDFETLKTLSALARTKYKMGGAVQHGASTLPAEAFHKFPEVETLEVHLATEFQNMIYESKHFPSELKGRMYEYLKTNAADERMSGDSDDQFFYRARKKALGPFKKDIMKLPQGTRDAIASEVEAKFDFLFQQIKVADTKEYADKYIKPRFTSFKAAQKSKADTHVAMTSEGAD